MEAPPSPQLHWPRPPDGGWTADDLDRLPDLPPHTELIDGSLIFKSRQNIFHTRTVSLVERQLDALAPEGLEVLHEFTIDIDRCNRLEPDVLVVDEDVVDDPDQTRLPASSVRLAVEVVKPDSVCRDRETKPVKYARAGIPHLWRVEMVGDGTVAYVYELDPATKAYVATGIFHDRLEVSVPFPIDLDLTETL
ncbi:Uma2 family endonuclease [Streptomyces bambusae]|uniref:Uma2 family endonuclease n=1 Tax=Streptomyces bambusae TaxID=1550616 RepID=A0ABS6Z783_9ACTN|nr:Uma2 family endonuclease [Streptomyces bambusae]MBW5483626.1 Uma2 family endonuclease [Streptomyces bambusae]